MKDLADKEIYEKLIDKEIIEHLADKEIVGYLSDKKNGWRSGRQKKMLKYDR